MDYINYSKYNFKDKEHYESNDNMGAQSELVMIGVTIHIVYNKGHSKAESDHYDCFVDDKFKVTQPYHGRLLCKN